MNIHVWRPVLGFEEKGKTRPNVLFMFFEHSGGGGEFPSHQNQKIKNPINSGFLELGF